MQSLEEVVSCGQMERWLILPNCETKQIPNSCILGHCSISWHSWQSSVALLSISTTKNDPHNVYRAWMNHGKGSRSKIAWLFIYKVVTGGGSAGIWEGEKRGWRHQPLLPYWVQNDEEGKERENELKWDEETKDSEGRVEWMMEKEENEGDRREEKLCLGKGRNKGWRECWKHC